MIGFKYCSRIAHIRAFFFSSLLSSLSSICSFSLFALAYDAIDGAAYFVVSCVFGSRIDSLADFDENPSLECVKGLVVGFQTFSF
jgi:hypothetical protein